LIPVAQIDSSCSENIHDPPESPLRFTRTAAPVPFFLSKICDLRKRLSGSVIVTGEVVMIFTLESARKTKASSQRKKTTTPAEIHLKLHTRGRIIRFDRRQVNVDINRRQFRAAQIPPLGA